MKIYTSYFAQLRKMPREIVPVSIAVSTPPWFRGAAYKEVAPQYDAVCRFKAGTISWDEFSYLYQANILRFKDPRKTVNDLQCLADGRDVAVMCYEKSGDPCHRHIFSAWMNEHLGLGIREWYPQDGGVCNDI